MNPFKFAKTGIPPLVIVDFRVQLWRILPLAQKLQAQGCTEAELHQFIKASWAILLNRGPDALSPSDYTVVIVDDNGADKPYWRVNALAEHFAGAAQALVDAGGEPSEPYAGYKAGRDAKPDDFNLVAQIGLAYIAKHKLPYFTLPGYEADDWAGLMAYQRVSELEFSDGLSNLAAREVFLYTIDRDWEQLAGRGVYWVNTGPWLPRIRGEQEVVDQIVKRSLKRTLRKMGPIKYASQIVEQKSIEGDKSDNLPPGSPRWAIDLLIMHPEHGLAYQPASVILPFMKAINSGVANTNWDHVKQSFNWIASRGYPLLFAYDDFFDHSWREDASN